MDIKIIHVSRSLPKLNPQQVIIVDRKCSLLGNPYTHLPIEKTKASFKVGTVEEAVKEYDGWLLRTIKEEFNNHHRPIGNALTTLYNKSLTLHINGRMVYLACHCKDELEPLPSDHSCHCDVLRTHLLARYKRDCNTYKGVPYLTEIINIKDKEYSLYYRQNNNTFILISVSDSNSEILQPLSGTFYNSVESMIDEVKTHI